MTWRDRIIFLNDDSAWVPVLGTIGVVLLFVAPSIIVFVIGKCVLQLTLSWWWIILAPVWFAVAFFAPGGFCITNAVLLFAGAMLIPWWVWVVSVITDFVIIAYRFLNPPGVIWD